jgi:hypothetical protein
MFLHLTHTAYTIPLVGLSVRFTYLKPYKDEKDGYVYSYGRWRVF